MVPAFGADAKEALRKVGVCLLDAGEKASVQEANTHANRIERIMVKESCTTAIDLQQERRRPPNTMFIVRFESN